MNYQTIGDIYKANDRIRARLINMIGKLSPIQADLRTENGKWTVQGMVEHLAKVEIGMTRISAKLLQKAEAAQKTSNGKASLSKEFLEKIAGIDNKKFEAPETVAPTGVQTIAESLSLMETSRASLNALRVKFEEFDGTELTFPHPVFGQMTAQDWLALIGGHESRHMEQIERILSNGG